MNITNMTQKITIQKGKLGEPDKKRKCFYYEDSDEKPILAAGILFIKQEKGKNFVLMQKVIQKDFIEYRDQVFSIGRKENYRTLPNIFHQLRNIIFLLLG